MVWTIFRQRMREAESPIQLAALAPQQSAGPTRSVGPASCRGRSRYCSTTIFRVWEKPLPVSW